jgi:competence protein ComFB
LVIILKEKWEGFILELTNYTLNWIWEVIEEVLADYPDFCKCDRCRYDIAAFAANRLPPTYVVSENGYVYTKTNILSQQKKTDILAEVVKAIEIVSKNPSHSI